MFKESKMCLNFFSWFANKKKSEYKTEKQQICIAAGIVCMLNNYNNQLSKLQSINLPSLDLTNRFSTGLA